MDYSNLNFIRNLKTKKSNQGMWKRGSKLKIMLIDNDHCKLIGISTQSKDTKNIRKKLTAPHVGKEWIL